MTTLGFFPEQAHRFATTRETYAQTQVHVDRTIDEYRKAAAALAVEHIRVGDLEGARMVMDDVLVEQCRLAKIRHLELVPGPCRERANRNVILGGRQWRVLGHDGRSAVPRLRHEALNSVLSKDHNPYRPIPPGSGDAERGQ